jgi:hypothetical protein
MKTLESESLKLLVFTITTLFLCTETAVVNATEPCGDFGECKTLIEINASDGDIGFHFLMDGDDIKGAMLKDPNGAKVYQNLAKGPLLDQKLTELFVESAEPLCWADPEADPGEEIVILEEFLERWTTGSYRFSAKGDQGERLIGETDLTHSLPAAPVDVEFDGGVISWAFGQDLGKCGSVEKLNELVSIGILPEHPKGVTIAAWEIVLEPDVEDGDPLSTLKYTIRLPGDLTPKEVTVPADYLASLPPDTPVKVEVGAIGEDDNATFTEEDGFCVNESEGCD